MKSLYTPFVVLSLVVSAQVDSFAQGCVAIRHMSTNYGVGTSSFLQKGQWQLTASARYLHSFRHFSGTQEQKQRLEQNTEVINRTTSLDLGLTYAITDRWNLNVTLPLVYSERSSLYEHDRINRHSSFAKGIGDVRIGASYWLFPTSQVTHNLSLGLSVKVPTGQYNAMSTFYTVTGPQTRPVDQSIQPGDGGVALSLELAGFKRLGAKTYVGVNGFYMVNPRNTNGTRTFRETLSPLLANESIMSVPDQYLVRAGITQSVGTGFSAMLNGRIEGIPVRDLIGKSDGFRRPGYIISIEPGVSYMWAKNILLLNVPIALQRNRLQSLTDKQRQAETGTHQQGDAAFADYLPMLTYVRRF